MTLIEVMVSSAVFAVTFGGMLMGQKIARYHAEKSLISFVITHHSQGLLEAIQSYSYESVDYRTNGVSFALHPEAVKANYNTKDSGVYNEDGTELIPGGQLPEESLTLLYHPTALGNQPTALAPFIRNATLQNNNRLMGPENSEDVSLTASPADGLYKIKASEQARNTFAKNGKGQEKYFFMDDVDDFDGYQETQEILPKVFVTFDISVSGIYDNVEDYPHTLLTTNPMPQKRYSVMQEEMSVSHFQSKVHGGSDPNARTVAADYYNKMLFKKITVLATWTYPPGSNKTHRLVMDGGKMNPSGDAQ
jgi:hypothetical protein